MTFSLFRASALSALPCGMPRSRHLVWWSPHLPSVRVRQLHENMSRFFSLLFPWRDAVTEEIEVPDWRLRGARPRYDASLL